MGRLKGPVQFTGKLGNTISYTLNGKQVIRMIGEVKKEAYKKHPNYEHVRFNNKEFGGAATMGKYLRTAFRKFPIVHKNNTLKNKLTSIIRICIGEGQGPKGQRTFQWKTVNSFFEYVSFNVNEFLMSFVTSLPTISFDYSNFSGTIEWNDTDLLNFKNLPKTTGHVKLEISLIPVQDFTFNTYKLKYETENELIINNQIYLDLPGITKQENTLNYNNAFQFNFPDSTPQAIFAVLNLTPVDNSQTPLKSHTFILQILS